MKIIFDALFFVGFVYFLTCNIYIIHFCEKHPTRRFVTNCKKSKAFYCLAWLVIGKEIFKTKEENYAPDYIKI